MTTTVIVTRHAFERARERFPDVFGGMTSWACNRAIRAEVKESIEAGRMAVTLPRWAVRPGETTRRRASGRRRRGVDANRSNRYVWSADQCRVYLVSRTSSRVMVITVTPGERDISAAA